MLTVMTSTRGGGCGAVCGSGANRRRGATAAASKRRVARAGPASVGGSDSLSVDSWFRSRAGDLARRVVAAHSRGDRGVVHSTSEGDMIVAQVLEGDNRLIAEAGMNTEELRSPSQPRCSSSAGTRSDADAVFGVVAWRGGADKSACYLLRTTTVGHGALSATRYSLTPASPINDLSTSAAEQLAQSWLSRARPEV